MVDGVHNNQVYLQNLIQCEVLEIDGEEDHLYILFDAPSQIILANTINSLKL